MALLSVHASYPCYTLIFNDHCIQETLLTHYVSYHITLLHKMLGQNVDIIN